MGARVRRWADPEDIVQRALIETMRSLGALPEGAGEEELLRRLYRTASTRIVDTLRSHRREAGESMLPKGVLEPAAAASVEGPVTRQDERRWLRELISRLPDTYRETVRLCALEGLTFAEAAEHLGLSEPAVRKRYERARQVLARLLRERGER